MATAAADLFATVPTKDHLSLFVGSKAQGEKVVNFYGFKKAEISQAADVPIGSVRYDRMPRELEERIKEWALLANLVAGFFKGDATKTSLWFTTRNPMLGGVEPRTMIRFGRTDKLRRFVLNALAENRG
jgi:hypothetical protein